MHTIEPYYKWREYYRTDEDPLSPYYQAQYSEFHFTNHIYNFAIHPQWDNFGSDTLLHKMLYVDYEQGYCIIELIGEWNDAINNDVMMFKREVADLLIDEGVRKFVLIGEHVLNFHSSDDSYYEEWFEDTEGGWVSLVNFHGHVIEEMKGAGLANYLYMHEELQCLDWRMLKPQIMFNKIQEILPELLV
jgi:hypothetical protein